MASAEPTESAAAAPAKRGRRLSEDRSDVILEAVLDLMEDVGYDQLRMQDIAERANVGLSTIYRRWPTKQDVVGAALRCKQAAGPWPDTGDPRADVRAILLEMGEKLNGEGGQSILGLLATMRAEPEVGDMFRETLLDGTHRHLRDCLAAELGEDEPDLDLRAAAGPAILIYTSAICGRSIDPEATADRLTRLLFAPGPD